MKDVFIAELFDGEKKTLRSSQDLNLGLLNAGQMLLPTEPLELLIPSSLGSATQYLAELLRHSPCRAKPTQRDPT